LYDVIYVPTNYIWIVFYRNLYTWYEGILLPSVSVTT
jgi:hypothetical protein